MHTKNESWIEIKNVSLDIPIYNTDKSFRSSLINKYIGGNIKTNKNMVQVQALRNISFSLKKGDRLGLIGHNGAGKSTLLNVLAGIYRPVIGNVEHNGTITPLFNLTPGLDPVDTGLENIYTIGMYLGMDKEEIRSKIDEIVAFTELEDFINLPVRTYSNGMVARLSFGVATSLEADILLIDEGIIGAGDDSFAKKAKTRLDKFYDKINILVLASHSRDLIKQLCNKAILLEHGNIKAFDTVERVFELYDSQIQSG
jgi:ABC-type polysaccharide/polyol phosphate transport system ATPase subunit